MTIPNIYLSLLIFAPLAFGTVELWSLAIMEIGSMATLLAYLRRLKKQKRPLYAVPGLTPFVLILLYTLLQLLPLPAAHVKLISPATHALYNNTIGLVDDVNWMRLSINPKATLAEFFRLASYFCFYVLTIQLLSRGKYLKKTAATVVVFAALLAVWAMVQSLAPLHTDAPLRHKIYWLRDISNIRVPFGPYVNYNHYAGLMGMLLPLSLSLFLFHRPTPAYGPNWRARFADWLSEIHANKHLLFGLASILIALSILLSLSRGGIISLGVALIVFVFLINIKKPGQMLLSGGLILCIILIIIFFASWFGWDTLVYRFSRLFGSRDDFPVQRLIFWRDCLNIIKAFPLFGTGMGTLVSIYPSFRTYPGDRVLDHAHNDYIELLTNGGLVAIVLFTWLMVSILYNVWRMMGRRHDRYAIYVCIGSLSGIVAILAHGVTDFNLQIGANGLYFVFLLGLAIAAANARLRRGHPSSYLKPLRPRRPRLAMGMGIVLLGACLLFNGGALMGRLHIIGLQEIRLNRGLPDDTLKQAASVLKKASRFDPLESRFRFDLGRVFEALDSRQPACNHFRQALRRNPANGAYLEALAHCMSQDKKIAKADQLFHAAVKCDMNNSYRYLRYAVWLFSQGEKTRGAANVRRALMIEPNLTDRALTLLMLNGFNDKEIQDNLPPRVAVHLAWAARLEQRGYQAMAERAYLKALTYIDNEQDVKANYYYQVYRYYTRHKRDPDALAILRQAVAQLPEDINLRLTIASLYEKIDIPYRARKEYQKVLVMNPKNRKALKGLERLRKSD